MYPDLYMTQPPTVAIGQMIHLMRFTDPKNGSLLLHPPCKIKSGKMINIDYVRKSGTRVKYSRPEYVPKKRCTCAITEDLYPTASADMNLAENAQGMLRKIVKDMIDAGDCQWRGNAQKKNENCQESY